MVLEFENLHNVGLKLPTLVVIWLWHKNHAKSCKVLSFTFSIYVYLNRRKTRLFLGAFLMHWEICSHDVPQCLQTRATSSLCLKCLYILPAHLLQNVCLPSLPRWNKSLVQKVNILLESLRLSVLLYTTSVVVVERVATFASFFQCQAKIVDEKCKQFWKSCSTQM